MIISVVCPFNLERLTGTPIRTKVTISSLRSFSEVYSIDTSLYGNTNIGIIKFTFVAIKLLKKQKPEFVHGISTLSVLPIILYKLLFNRRVKTIFEIHGWSWYELAEASYFKRVVFGVMDVIGYKLSNGVISMSFSQKDFLFKNFGKKKKIQVIWGPADFEVNFTKTPPRETLKVGYIGNDSFWQGLRAVLSAAKTLESNDKIIFELAGFDYSDTRKFLQQKNIRYIGRVERNKVRDFISDMDIMLSPRVRGNVSELQYPQKISEYLAGGRPIIASAVSDQSMIIRKSGCGYIVKEVSGSEIAEAINTFASLPKEVRDNMSDRATSFAQEEVTVPVFTKKIREFYNTL